MDLNELKKLYPDEASCRSFFESIIWSSGRTCPHCGNIKSWNQRGTEYTSAADADSVHRDDEDADALD